MATKDVPNYYEVLGVPKDATQKQIKKRRWELAKKYKLDRLYGLRDEYRESGGELLLEEIEEKIRLATEAMKEINAANEVLSDPVERAKHDQKLEDAGVATPQPPPPPEIVVSPTKINFGLVSDKTASSFVVENRGGPVDKISILWQTKPKPSWGELILKVDPDNICPVKATVEFDPTGLPAGPQSGWIEIVVDGHIYTVEVTANVAVPVQPQRPAKAAPPTPSPVPQPSPPGPGCGLSGILALMLSAVVTVGIFMAIIFMAIIRQADRLATEEVQWQEYEESLEKQAERVRSKPEDYIEIKRLSGGIDQIDNCGSFCDGLVFGEYQVTNQTQFLELELRGCALGSWPRTIYPIKPGETLSVFCEEYKYVDGYWDALVICLRAENWRNNINLTVCANPDEVPKKKVRLTDLVEVNFYMAETCIGPCSTRPEPHVRLEVGNVDAPFLGLRYLYEGLGRINLFLIEHGQYWPAQAILTNETSTLYDIFPKDKIGKTICLWFSAPYYENDRVCFVIPPP